MSSVKPLTLLDLNISCLNEDEKTRLMQVLQRNNKLVNNENVRLSRMDTEIKGELKSYQNKQSKSTAKECFNCMNDLKDFDGCEKCQKMVCGKCCQPFGSHHVMLCKVCYREMLLEAKKAKWFYDNIPQSTKSAEAEGILPEISQMEERRIQLASTSDETGYKTAVESIADKLFEIDVENTNLSKSRFGPKKTFGKPQVSQQKDKLKTSSQSEQESKENKIAMDNFIERFREYNEQLK